MDTDMDNRDRINTRTNVHTPQSAEAGALAGLISGAVMALIMMTRSLTQNGDFWLAMNQIAAMVYGPDALLGGTATLVGILIHFAVAAGWGLLFGLIASRISNTGAFWAGLIFGAAVWAIMTFAVLPLVNNIMRERVDLIPGWWFAYHLIYGAVLSLAAPFAKTFADRAEAHAHAHVPHHA